MNISVDITAQKEQLHAEVRYQAETIKEEMNEAAGISKNDIGY